MTDPVTTPDTERLRKLADAAAGGPWAAEHGSDWDLDGRQVPQSSVRRPDRVSITWDDHGGEVFVPADAEFIAAAREAVPALLDENARLLARIARLEAQAAIRGRAVVVYRDRARVAEAREEHLLLRNRNLLDAQVHAALDATAADIWDEGYEAGEEDGYLMGRDEPFDGTAPNPYRASENA